MNVWPFQVRIEMMRHPYLLRLGIWSVSLHRAHMTQHCTHSPTLPRLLLAVRGSGVSGGVNPGGAGAATEASATACEQPEPRVTAKQNVFLKTVSVAHAALFHKDLNHGAAHHASRAAALYLGNPAVLAGLLAGRVHGTSRSLLLDVLDRGHGLAPRGGSTSVLRGEQHV